MILWAGISSKDVGMVVEHYPSIIIPRRKQEVQQVPGRNGDIILYQDAYENYEQSYQVFLDAKSKGGLQKVIPKLSDWLLGHSGYQRLEDSYFPDVYRMAYYTGGVEFISIFNEYGAGTLTFNCAPEKYYKMGERSIKLTNQQLISNPTLFPAKPLITLNVDGRQQRIYFHHERTYKDTGLIIEDEDPYLEINPSNVRYSLSGIIQIDIKDHLMTHDYGVYNTHVAGLFDNMMLKGKTTIYWDSGISNVSIIPRWWTI